ncbi:DNA-3-methyladenine glycosylase II [Paraburkholderia unamae]|uniref:DNA-3-methyladenine glycosylase 2 family protein n=1 Tax=Paraburkholderia unamae TaxID=219649 RepID=UPI000DC38014|nr:AlkA N-terminal domain-containing protein [Paraburkholderia unamae]RAR57172.1 DNA-3-methyladenine glycosylase II [Paraburkholderia unamae]
MRLDPETCYQSMLSKDRRFDGWFFVGVSSTGIYCRPVCPVRPPKLANCTFFPNAATAERAGFRPCLRCRPELAPGNGLLDVSSRLARAAAALVEEGFLNTGSVAALAARIGVTDRHLRRIFDAEFGVSLIEFAQTQRLLMAKRLLTDTCLPVNTVALASGFGSVRRFNDLFLKRYGLNPLRFRKGPDAPQAESMTFALGYRPPFCWSGILGFLERRSIDTVEHIGDDVYSRTVALHQGGRNLVGWISVRHAPHRYALDVTVPVALAPAIGQILARVRRLFDLAARPDLIEGHLGDLACVTPGMRVPGSLDGFEIAVRAIVGQQDTMSDAREILSRVADHFGMQIIGPQGLTRTFPAADTIACAPVAALREAGATQAHAEAVIAVAQAVSSGRMVLEPAAPLEETLAALRRIRGIGEWAVQYIAMRALGWPNAFPDDNPATREPPDCPNPPQPSHHGDKWQPWRAYATVRIWEQLEGQRP